MKHVSSIRSSDLQPATPVVQVLDNQSTVHTYSAVLKTTIIYTVLDETYNV